MLYDNCGTSVYVLCSKRLSGAMAETETQNSTESAAPQTQNQPAAPAAECQETVVVYVPVQGQGPDYVSKSAGAGKS
jgi:hypothetical protein